jgi:hypothetical protein
MIFLEARAVLYHSLCLVVVVVVVVPLNLIVRFWSLNKILIN